MPYITTDLEIGPLELECLILFDFSPEPREILYPLDRAQPGFVDPTEVTATTPKGSKIDLSALLTDKEFNDFVVALIEEDRKNQAADAAETRRRTGRPSRYC